jgi:hypothetical protein
MPGHRKGLVPCRGSFHRLCGRRELHGPGDLAVAEFDGGGEVLGRRLYPTGPRAPADTNPDDDPVTAEVDELERLGGEIVESLTSIASALVGGKVGATPASAGV